MQKWFERDFDSLSDIFDFMESFFSIEGIDSTHLFTMSFAAEELFTNMIKYNPGNLNEILISVSRVNDKLALCLTDFDVDAFDVTQVGAVSLNQPLKERNRGGLGLHIVRQMVDAMTYEYANRQSKITVIKNLT